MVIDFEKLKNNLDESLNSETEESINAFFESKGFKLHDLRKISFSKEQYDLFLKDFSFLKKDNIGDIASELNSLNQEINNIIEIKERYIYNLIDHSKDYTLRDILFMMTQNCKISLSSYIKALEILNNSTNFIEFIIIE